MGKSGSRAGITGIKDDPDWLNRLDEWDDRSLVKLANHYGRSVTAPVKPDCDLLNLVSELRLDTWPSVEESTAFLREEIGILRVSTETEGKRSGDEMVREVYECAECHKTVSTVETSGFRGDRFAPVIRAGVAHQLNEHHKS